MITTSDNLWIAACAHRLQMHWRSVDPAELEVVASEIAHDPHLRDLPPAEAAAEWLRPVEPVLGVAKNIS